MAPSGTKRKASPAATRTAPTNGDGRKPPSSRLDKSDDSERRISENAMKSKSKRHVRFHQDLDDLKKEMEVVPFYGVVAETGQLRRKPLRLQAKAQTRKRKILEQQDVQEFTVERDEDDVLRKRLRGPRAAAEDAVIRGSLIFEGTAGTNQQSLSAAPNGDSEEDDQDEQQSDHEQDSEVEELVEQGNSDEEEEEEEEQDEEEVEEDMEDDDDEAAEEENDEAATSALPPPRLRKSQYSFKRPPRRKKTSRIFRLRNFKSMKMTNQHGEALAAFARGRPREAIEKLQQVARELPSAPQVYSSLGMVYEEMLLDLQKKRRLDNMSLGPSQGRVRGASGERDDSSGSNVASDKYGSDVDELAAASSLDNLLSEQLVLAKKAYGSYHIAALLCKKDYTFWVRAGDLAANIGELHAEIMTLNDMTDGDREHHRSEKQRWLSEAKNDYQTADNIKPPGIDVPAKLASVCMELGCLSEALTLLTDLKNRKPVLAGERSDFESSYKTWLLYADLMLRIGHECLKWNEGDQSTGNSFFRRWLRRHSRTFEWEERRLQALGKALEAAAGSKCCIRLTDWLKLRASNETTGSSDGATFVGCIAGVTQDDGNQFEREKSLLLSKQATELADFDKTTSEIDDESGLMPSEQRGNARRELLLRQKDALQELEGEFGRDKECLSNDLTNDAGQVPLKADGGSDNGPPLVLSASVKTVCAIASELMRHMLLLKSYAGGRLVGEAVSLYLKERASLLHKRLQSQRRFEETRSRLTSVLTSVLDSRRHGTREGIQEDTSDDESDCAVSDDDDLEASPPPVIDSLRKGALPPELNVLFSLSLLGERGRDFVAFMCLNSIHELEQESLSDLVESDTDSGVSYDVRWTIFKRSRTAPLRRTEAFALLENVVLDCNRDKDLADRLRPLFEDEVKVLVGAHLLDGSADERSTVTIDSRSIIHRVVIAAARFQLKSAESLISSLNYFEADELLKTASGTLTNLLEVVWHVNSDGSISPACVDILGALSRVFRLRTSFALAGDGMLDWVKRMEGAISILCGCAGNDFLPDVEESLSDMSSIPLPSDWLSVTRKAIALRAYNLSVSHNVARFSGWEKEFRLELLRRGSNVSSHFGIKMSDGLVSGILVPFENEIIDQWDMLQTDFAIQPDLSFRVCLETRRLSSWYLEAKTAYEKASQRHSISVYGEDDGLSILLAFSRACLLSARASQNTAHRNSLVLHALSVLLPLMQFVLKHFVWDAELGKAPDDKTSLLDWRHASADEKKEAECPQERRIRRRRAAHPKEDPHVALHASFSGERTTPLLSNLILIPSKTLLAAWNAVAVVQPPLTTASADELMAYVHHSLRQLRGCYTEKAVEIASLNVAAAVLNLMSHPDCSNPFLSLQSAALFASQAPKLGSSDRVFRHALPDREQCCPLEALVILARAECLQAVHFCTEAAFLCDYVASVCRLHRNGNSKQELCDRWTVIRAVAYCVSVSIRHTASILLSEVEKKSDIPSWSWRMTTIDELKRGREDCLAFMGCVQPSQNLSLPGFMEESEGVVGSFVAFDGYCPQTFEEDTSSPQNEQRRASYNDESADEVETVAV